MHEPNLVQQKNRDRNRAYRWAVDRAYQEAALPGVSRTFALTIPQLPLALRDTVTNAYLLCRIADTLEDHSHLEPAGKHDLFVGLQEVLEGQRDPERWAGEVVRALAWDTPAAERDLVLSLPRVVAVTNGLSEAHQAAVLRCVSIMGGGMARFQRLKSPAGLPDQASFESYCYYVAGVVGEMLTELFAIEVEEIGERRDQMMELGRRFGLGLQATNVLKDVWDDRARGLCWLPRDLFGEVGCELEPEEEWSSDPAFRQGMRRMVGVATEYMEAARSYILLVPPSQPGIRRFCAWAATMSLATLRRIHRRPGFQSAEQIKITRGQVRRLAVWTSYAAERDGAMRLVLAWSGRGLPRPLVRSYGDEN
ncbi:squalene/phytoene synthase family protein [Halorhodospira abdelmalekii]|uniref:squalene/phytoene synthase family protein n=1 Tax=Halorhodospira abdelmalekii TaxID=421629 RepID=UPI0019035987